MATSTVKYLGDLRTECRHLQSGDKFITDAPVDNQGKGEAFSPTDTVATALASCMLTTIGIKVADRNINIEGAVAEVTKTMASDPRRISGIKIVLNFPRAYAEKERKLIENIAKTCPVWYSIHPDIQLDITFNYS